MSSVIVYSIEIFTAFYGILFVGNEEAAFSNFRLFEATGSVITYMLSPMFCTQTKLIVLVVLMSVGMLGYFNNYNVQLVKLHHIQTVFSAGMESWSFCHAKRIEEKTAGIKRNTEKLRWTPKCENDFFHVEFG